MELTLALDQGLHAISKPNVQEPDMEPDWTRANLRERAVGRGDHERVGLCLSIYMGVQEGQDPALQMHTELVQVAITTSRGEGGTQSFA